MESEALPERTRSRQRLQRLSHELQRDWGVTVRMFHDYREMAPHRRYRALGVLFERLCPWIERGIQGAVLNHFVLVPTEQALARAFSHSTQKEALPKSYVLYLYWIESLVMRGLVHPTDPFNPERHTPGDPSPGICSRFNRLPFLDRSLLYLYVVEGCSPTEVCDNTGVPFPKVIESIGRLWAIVRADEDKTKIPSTWQIPQCDERGHLRWCSQK